MMTDPIHGAPPMGRWDSPPGSTFFNFPGSFGYGNQGGPQGGPQGAPQGVPQEEEGPQGGPPQSGPQTHLGGHQGAPSGDNPGGPAGPPGPHQGFGMEDMEMGQMMSPPYSGGGNFSGFFDGGNM